MGSAHNLPTHFQDAEFPDGAKGGDVAEAGYTWAAGKTVPTDGDSGYAPGCFFFHIDGSTAQTLTYRNEGTKASCDFNALTFESGQVTGCEVYNDGTQSVANTTNAAVLFDSEIRDVGGCHSVASNTSRFTAPKAGLYNISAQVAFAPDATGLRSLIVVKNGGDTTSDRYYAKQTALNTGGSAGLALNIAANVYLDANDYLEIYAYQDSGGALNIGGAASTDDRNQVYASFYRIGG